MRSLTPFLERIENDLGAGPLPSFWASYATPLAWEIGWPWVSGRPRIADDVDLLAALGLFLGELPLLGTTHFERYRSLGVAQLLRDGAPTLRRSSLWIGRATGDGGIVEQRPLGPCDPTPEGAVLRPSAVHRVGRAAPPEGCPVVYLRVPEGEQSSAVMATVLPDAVWARIGQWTEVAPPDDVPIPAIGDALARLRALRVLVGGTSAPLLGGTPAPAVQLDPEATAAIGWAVQSVLWRPVVGASKSVPGVLLLACADGETGRALAGEVARLGIAAAAGRMRMRMHAGARAVVEGWVWGAPCDGWSDAFGAFGHRVGWSGPAALTDSALEAGVPPVRPEETAEARRVRRLRHARWLLRSENRAFSVTRSDAWATRFAILSALGRPEHLTMPLGPLADSRDATTAVARAAQALGRDPGTLALADLPEDPWRLLELRGVGPATVEALDRLLDTAIEVAARPSDAPEEAANENLQEGLDALEALY